MRLLLPSIYILLSQCTAPVKPVNLKETEKLPNTELLNSQRRHSVFLQKEVTLNYKNAPLPKILEQIKAQTNCFFSGNTDLRDSAGLFSIKCIRLPLRECLERIANQNGTIKFRIPYDVLDTTMLIINVDDSLNPEYYNSEHDNYDLLKSKITLNMKDVSLMKIIKSIEKQERHSYFSVDVFQANSLGRFSIQVKDLNLKKCLQQIMKQNNRIKFTLAKRETNITYLSITCCVGDFSGIEDFALTSY